MQCRICGQVHAHLVRGRCFSCTQNLKEVPLDQKAQPYEIHLALEAWAIEVLEKELEKINAQQSSKWSFEEYIRRIITEAARSIRDRAPEFKEKI